MKLTLRKAFADCLADSNETHFEIWVFKWPTQLVLLAESVNYSLLIEKSIVANDLKNCLDVIDYKLKKIVQLVSDNQDS
jgi:hypothetical protein